MSMRLLRIFFLSTLFCGLGLGCVHTQSHETAVIDLFGSPTVESEVFGDIEVRSVVYRPSKLPLEEFFSRLGRGEFKEAFDKIDLDYQQANTNDNAMVQLIDHGYIPAYIQIKNTGSSEISFNEKDFVLVSPSGRVKAFYSDQLPSEFKNFYPPAALANVYNMSITMAGIVGVLAAMVWLDGRGTGSPEIPVFGGFEDVIVLNNTILTTKIDYKDYLIRGGTIEPQKTKQGLLFFKFDDLMGIHKYRLIFGSD